MLYSQSPQYSQQHAERITRRNHRTLVYRLSLVLIGLISVSLVTLVAYELVLVYQLMRLAG